MGSIRGEWVFPDGAVPTLDDIVEALGVRMGLAVKATHDDDGTLVRADVPVINEFLFGWDRKPDRILVHSLLPGHPYVWAQLNAVMEDSGGRISDTVSAWRPELDTSALERPWSELSGRQRLVLRLPTIGAWRPLDFLAQRGG